MKIKNQKFYEGCTVCKKISCPERCFECSQPDIAKKDWLHSIGSYFPRTPRFKEQHRASPWTQAILKAKKHSIPVISRFGRIVAYYTDKELAGMKPYLITGVPGYTLQLLADSVFSSLEAKKGVDLTQALIQTRMKPRKQRHCRTDAQRRENIHGVYAVQNKGMIKNKNVILLDDVVTSGSTMKECAKKLFEAGARAVIGIALAKTVRMTPLVPLLN